MSDLSVSPTTIERPALVPVLPAPSEPPEFEFSDFDWAHDLAEQRALFRLCFPENEGGTACTEEHYRWKFHRFPAQPASHEFKVVSQGKLVGYYAAIPYRYVIDGHEMTGGMVCDVMTHPDLRGRGLFTRIGLHATEELKRRGIGFVTGFPIRPEVMPGHLKAGWSRAFALPICVHIVRSNTLLRAKGLAFLAPVANAVLGVIGLIASATSATLPSRTLSTEILPTEQFDRLKGYDEFFRAWGASQRHFLLKDKAFLKWRLSAPNSRYEVALLRDGSEIIAMAITRRMLHDGIPTLAVLDVMALPDVGRRIGILWRALKRLASESHAEVIAGVFSRRWARRYHLLASGFLRLPVAITFISKSLNNPIADSEFLREIHWHLCWIDSDDG